MKWIKEKADFLALAGLMVALAGLMVALTGIIISSIKDFKDDTQRNIEVLRTDTQKSIEVLRADTQKSIETLQADVREIRTLIITHIVDHHNQSLSASVQKKPTLKKKSRDVSSTTPPSPHLGQQ